MQLHQKSAARLGSSTHHARSNARRVLAAPRAASSSVILSSDRVELGKSGIVVPAVGVGAWSWGDRSGYWGYGIEYGKEQSREAFKAMIDAGLTFIDTAEVYGFGKSEEFLGEFLKEAGPAAAGVQVATKFAPLPWRLTSDSVPLALKASLGRMQQSSCALYMIHWPGFLFTAFSNEAFVEGLAKCKQQGLCEAVGVSNFNAARVRSASKALAASGIPLASNQIQYSMLYRAPETNGVLEACRENGVMPVAYSPLCQGLLTGKYKAGGEIKPFGPRGPLFTDDKLRAVQPLLRSMEAIASERGKTMAQIATNWCICKNTLPIPGAKNAKQLQDLAGSLGWRLSDGEMAELDKESGKLNVGLGAPFENW